MEFFNYWHGEGKHSMLESTAPGFPSRLSVPQLQKKEGASAGWPLSYPLAQSPLRRSLDGSPVRFGLEHRRTF